MTETNRMPALLEEWYQVEAKKAEQLKADLAELEQFRSTGLNPVQVRALNNMLTVMRTFLSAVDDDDAFAPMPPINGSESIEDFWDEK